MIIPVDWLLEGPPYIQFRAHLDLLGNPDNSSQVVKARQGMLAQPEILEMIKKLREWPGTVLNSHKSASQPFHTLNFLADIGIKADDPGMNPIIEKILSSASPEGPFRLPMNISPGHGGTGMETAAWALCDAPNLVYALMKMGMAEDLQVKKAYDHLAGLVMDFGWPCSASPELGSFRGPGRKTDPCPYANLAMLKIMSLSAAGIAYPAARIGTETLLNLWQNRREAHPFIFYMGNDFCKLKAPLIWYDILHVLYVLSNFPYVLNDLRFRDMLGVAVNKMNSDGSFIAESIYNPYKHWEFGQKKVPSRWITLIMHQILQKAGNGFESDPLLNHKQLPSNYSRKGSN